MAQRITGTGGAADVGFGATTVYFRRWSINDYGPISVDITAFGDAARRRGAGIKDWSFTAEGTLDLASSLTVATAAVSCTFTQAASRTWVGDAIVRVSPAVQIDGEAIVTVNGDGDGDLTLA